MPDTRRACRFRRTCGDRFRENLLQASPRQSRNCPIADANLTLAQKSKKIASRYRGQRPTTGPSFKCRSVPAVLDVVVLMTRGRRRHATSGNFHSFALPVLDLHLRRADGSGRRAAAGEAHSTRGWERGLCKGTACDHGQRCRPDRPDLAGRRLRRHRRARPRRRTRCARRSASSCRKWRTIPPTLSPWCISPVMACSSLARTTSFRSI